MKFIVTFAVTISAITLVAILLVLTLPLDQAKIAADLFGWAINITMVGFLGYAGYRIWKVWKNQ